VPILDVEIVLRPGEAIRRGLAAELADRAAEVFGGAPQTTWVKVTGLTTDQYAENGPESLEDVQPVFVSVLKAKLPRPDEMQEEISRLVAAIAQVCRCPQERVHVLYLPEGAGRVAFGGKLLGR
jgi:phenylpyruvate tautomerase PptA (4-oxalocrotonate tautomerase family)